MKKYTKDRRDAVANSLSLPIKSNKKMTQEGRNNGCRNPEFLNKRRDLKSLSQDQRQSMGLVIKPNPDIFYGLLEDKTKVCRCCQNRKVAICFNNTKASIDGKETRCTSCVSIDRRIKRNAYSMKRI